VLVAAGGVSLAQTQPRAVEKPACLEGEVRNSVSGLPVQRAHVTLRRFSNDGDVKYGATTNAEGKFTIAGLPPGSYAVSLQRVGFVALMDAVRNTVTLKDGERKDDFKVKLVPVGAISGRVLDADGQPVETIAVQVEQGGRTVRSGMTDDRGRFRIGGLTPGRYRVRAVPLTVPLPPEICTDGTAEVQYAATWHPGTIAAKGAARVSVGPAGESDGHRYTVGPDTNPKVGWNRFGPAGRREERLRANHAGQRANEQRDSSEARWKLRGLEALTGQVHASGAVQQRG